MNSTTDLETDQSPFGIGSRCKWYKRCKSDGRVQRGGVFIQPGAIGFAAGGGDANRAPSNIIFDEIRVGTPLESVTPHAAVDENYWAHYMISSDEGFVDTGVWLGLIRVFEHDYIWSYQLSKWLYGPEELVDENGGWLYAPKF